MYRPIPNRSNGIVSISNRSRFHRRLTRAVTAELLLRDYKKLQHKLTLLCMEQESKVEKSLQSLLEVTYPMHGDLLWDCKLSEFGDWQRSHTAAGELNEPIGEVIAHRKETEEVIFRIFADRSNSDIDSVRIATGELTLPLRWCKCRIQSLSS
jgi:hypothetical protein